MPSPALVARLRAAGCVYAEDEAGLLEAEASDGADLARMVAERVAGRPLEQVLGWAEFAGVRVRMAPGVFVPRRRSTLLVDLADEHVGEGSVVLDLCCGSGAVAAAVRSRHPAADVYAADRDPAAVGTARTNLGPERVFAGDLFDALPVGLHGRIDVVIVNAPYVPTAEIARMPPEARDHEHRIALDGGADGLAVHRRVAAGVAPWLCADGVVLIESSSTLATRSAELFEAAGLATEIRDDDRVSGTAVRARNQPRNRTDLR